MDKKAIQFIVAEIILALEYLHSVGVSHRDLKPENIFITEQGHLKLGDFGCAGVSQQAREELKIKNHKHKDNIKEDGKLNTFVGTKEYVPPEILKGDGSCHSSDMWSLGVIIYKLYTGTTPFFSADSEYFTFQNIMECKYQIPENIPKEARDLIEKLLVFNPKDRLNAVQIKNHSFFDHFKFEDLYNSYSPLLSLYNQRKETEVGLESIDDDQFEEDDNFDEDFDDWIAHSPKNKLDLNYNLINDRPTSPTHNYIKKSSSLGEKEFKELHCHEDEEKEDKRVKDEKLEMKIWTKISKIMQDDSKENLSNDNTYDSAFSPTIPDKFHVSPSFIDNKSDDNKNLNHSNDSEKIIVWEGYIKKITAWIIYKRRYMELSYANGIPKLVYYTASNKMKLRNEIPLTKLTKVYVTGPSKFEISNHHETCFFKDCGGETKVKNWVVAISKAIASLNFRKGSIKAGKALSASFC